MVHKCFVKGCGHSMPDNKDLAYFRLPKDIELQKQWLLFIGISEDTRCSSTIRVCEAHFERACIWKRFPRPLLVPGSIPTIKTSKETGEVANPSEENQCDCTTSSTHENASLVPENDVEMLIAMDVDQEKQQSSTDVPNDLATPANPDVTPKSRRLRSQRQTIFALRSKVNRLRAGRGRPRGIGYCKRNQLEDIISETTPFLSAEQHTLLASLLRKNSCDKGSMRYTDAEKDIALSIFYHSKKTYRFLKGLLLLPSERTLRQYQSKFPVYPGLNISVLSEFKAKLSSRPVNERVVSLLVDEISLFPEIHYNPHKDQFDGVCDDGCTRQPEAATNALVAMITWLGKPMKQVVGYWFLGGTGNSARTHEIILTTIEKLYEVGIIVKVLICDQGPRNIGLRKKLGITEDKPYFIRFNHKIYLLFDPPHLFKSFRNNLIKKVFWYKVGYVYWSVLEKIFQFSKTYPLNLIPKISEKHFSLTHFSKMTVSLATQIFSQSMYTALLVYKTMYPQDFDQDNCKTAEFILTMDKLFDSFNSSLARETVPNKLNYAISESSPHKNFLMQTLADFENAKFEGCAVQPPCLQGMRLAMNAILQLFEELRIDYGINELRTRRLNQDPLENLFAVIRQQHGCNVNPSPRQFETGIRHILITQLGKLSSLTNCESDKNKGFIKLSTIQKHGIPTRVCTFQSDLSGELDNAVESEPLFEVADFTRSNALFYISGYLAKVFLQAHHCKACENTLQIQHDTEFRDHKLFTVLKQYQETKGLVHVKESVYETITTWEHLFNHRIRSILHCTDLSNLFTSIDTPQIILCTPETGQLLFRTYFRIRCHWEARFLRRELKHSKKPVKSVKRKCSN